MMNRLRIKRQRRGATVVEAALVLPFFLLFCFVMLEVSHAIFVHAILRNAARDAARFATTERADTDQVKALVSRYCRGVLNSDLIEIRVCDASGYDDGTIDLADPNDRDSLTEVEVADLEANSLFMVQCKVNYNEISLINLGSVRFFEDYFKDVLLEGRSFMRRE